MGREESYLTILEATARIQRNVALILEAKAAEADLTRSWITGYVHPSHYQETSGLRNQSLEVHDHLVEVIEGLTKMEHSLAKNLRAVLNKEEGPGLGGATGFGELFGAGGDSG